jgi:hypothetical protein
MSQNLDIPNRREGPDLWVSIVNVLVTLIWVILLIIIMLMSKAQPEFISMIDRAWGAYARTYWEPRILKTVFYIMWGGLGCSLIGYFISKKRFRRKGEKPPFTFKLIGGLSIVGIIWYLANQF